MPRHVWITGHGDKDVYNKLNPELAKRLPRESTEWRRWERWISWFQV